MDIAVVAGIVGLVAIIYQLYDWYNTPEPWNFYEEVDKVLEANRYNRYWYTCTPENPKFTKLDIYDMYLEDPYINTYYVPYTDPDTVMSLAERLIVDLAKRTNARRKR